MIARRGQVKPCATNCPGTETKVKPMPAAAEAVRRYCAFLLKPENSNAYGVKNLVRTSGFVGLTLADIIRPDCTF